MEQEELRLGGDITKNNRSRMIILRSCVLARLQFAQQQGVDMFSENFLLPGDDEHVLKSIHNALLKGLIYHMGFTSQKMLSGILRPPVYTP